MLLAAMVLKDEDALVCDFAETYHILNWRALSPLLAAKLAFGLHENSRIKRAITGQQISLSDTILAAILDKVNWLAWAQTRDGQKGRNRPKSILADILGEKKESANMAFDSGEEFEAYRKKLIERSEQNA